MKLNVQNISQNDPKHKSKKLGTSTICTVGSDGCLVTCVTAVCNYHGKTITVAELNDALVKVKGFQNGALLVYSAITQVFPDIAFDWDVWAKGECSSTPAPLTLIDEILTSNRIPIVKVDYNPSTSKLDEHWVAIIGKDEAGSYFIMDPIDGSVQYFQSRYGEPSRYIFRIVAYSGPIPSTQEEEKSDYVKQLEADRLKFWTERDVLQKEVRELKKQIVSLNNQIASMAKTIEEIKTEDVDAGKKEYEAELKLQEAEKQILWMQDEVRVLRETEKALKTALVNSTGLPGEGVKTKWEQLKQRFLTFIKNI